MRLLGGDFHWRVCSSRIDGERRAWLIEAVRLWAIKMWMRHTIHVNRFDARETYSQWTLCRSARPFSGARSRVTKIFKKKETLGYLQMDGVLRPLPTNAGGFVAIIMRSYTSTHSRGPQ